MSSDGDLLDAVWNTAMDLIDPPDSLKWEPLPHQIPPVPPWFLWLLLGGRGTGKTATCAKYVHDHVHGPPCLPGVPGGHWISIVGPTLGDAATSCVEGPSGLRLWDPGIKVINRPGGLICRWSNGAEAKLFGANSPNDVERFRAGGNRCLVWLEEFAAWRYMEDAWQQIRYGLRSGPRPHAVGSTTPRSKRLLKELLADDKVKFTHGTTEDNPYLDPTVKAALYKDYGGTRMGRQELYGEILEDIEGALWTAEVIDAYRAAYDDAFFSGFDRVVVGVDPAASEGGDEHGIVVCGMINRWQVVKGGFNKNAINTEYPHGFVIEDASMNGSPNAWAKRAIRAYREHRADAIICEVNNGGEMVINTIRTIDPGVNVLPVWASRGKTKRAEPVASLYEQGRIHHLGAFPKLEDQMCEWDAADPDDSWSPDRMDAMVWAFSYLMCGAQPMVARKQHDTRLKGRR